MCKFANVLKANGVKKGDRVTIYLPMIPEAAYAMLACARIGAVHSVVFGGFSPDSLAGRIVDADSKFIITADEGVRGGTADPAQEEHRRGPRRSARATRRCWSCAAPARPIAWTAGRDIWLHEELVKVDADCPPVEMSAEDPLFILYTSGSTGKPKGVLHTTGGYLVYAAITHQYVFDYHDGDIYWCTADVGWVTGHSYILYGPLANGATTLMFEGVPNYPTASRFWHVVDKWDVNIFYTAPTAIRALMGAGDDFVKRTDRSSLRLLGIGRRADQSGGLGVVSPRRRRRPLPDRRHLVADRDRRHPDHAAARRHQAQARLGDAAVLRHQAGAGGREGQRARRRGQRQPRHPRQLAGADAHASIGDHERFVQTYFSTYKGMYFTGDGCRRDEDGYYWITGRVDDVINVSGHRLGTAEVESALVSHPKVAEAAVVGYPHDIKGQGIYCYVTLIAGQRAERGAAQGAGRARAQGDRPDRLAGPDPVLARPAQDALGQDHAPHPAQDRRGRVLQPGRYLHAGRSGRGRRPRQQPAEQEAGRGRLTASRRTSTRRRYPKWVGRRLGRAWARKRDLRP